MCQIELSLHQCGRYDLYRSNIHLHNGIHLDCRNDSNRILCGSMVEEQKSIELVEKTLSWKTWLLPNFRVLWQGAKEVYGSNAPIAFVFTLVATGLPFFFYFSDQAVNNQVQCERSELGCQADDTLTGLSLLIPIPIIGYAWYKIRLEKPWKLKRMRKKLLQELRTNYE